jgi:hypothetical protein
MMLSAESDWVRLRPPPSAAEDNTATSARFDFDAPQIPMVKSAV